MYYLKNYQNKEAQKNIKNEIMLMMLMIYRKNMYKHIFIARIKFINKFISYNNKNKINMK